MLGNLGSSDHQFWTGTICSVLISRQATSVLQIQVEEELPHPPDHVEVADVAAELPDLALDGVEGLLLALRPRQGPLEAARLEARSDFKVSENLFLALA